MLGWTLPALRRAGTRRRPRWRRGGRVLQGGVQHRPGRCGPRVEELVAIPRRGKRAGPQGGFPRFKSRRRATPSCGSPPAPSGSSPTAHHVTLPRLGRIKTHESTRKLARRLEAGTARILSATVRCSAGRWFVSFTVEVQRTQRTPARPGRGGRRGPRHQPPGGAVHRRDGANPRHLEPGLRKLRPPSRPCLAANRPGPAHRRSGPRAAGTRPTRHVTRCTPGSPTCAATACTSSPPGLARDLRHGRGRGPQRRRDAAQPQLGPHIADAGFAEIRRQLDYKTRWNGGQLHVADRWYPSSKTCSGCGDSESQTAAASPDLHLHTPAAWSSTGTSTPRNLEQHVARSGRETVNGRGADRKTGPGPAGGCEASTPHQHLGKTGTVRWQRWTASDALTRVHSLRNGGRSTPTAWWRSSLGCAESMATWR